MTRDPVPNNQPSISGDAPPFGGTPAPDARERRAASPPLPFFFAQRKCVAQRRRRARARAPFLETICRWFFLPNSHPWIPSPLPPPPCASPAPLLRPQTFNTLNMATKEAIIKAISGLGERGGSSLAAIKKALVAEGWDFDAGNQKSQLLKGLKSGVEKGYLIQNKGSYKIDKVKTAPKKKAAPKKAGKKKGKSCLFTFPLSLSWVSHGRFGPAPAPRNFTHTSRCDAENACCIALRASCFPLRRAGRSSASSTMYLCVRPTHRRISPPRAPHPPTTYCAQAAAAARCRRRRPSRRSWPPSAGSPRRAAGRWSRPCGPTPRPTASTRGRSSRSTRRSRACSARRRASTPSRRCSSRSPRTFPKLPHPPAAHQQQPRTSAQAAQKAEKRHGAPRRRHGRAVCVSVCVVKKRGEHTATKRRAQSDMHSLDLFQFQYYKMCACCALFAIFVFTSRAQKLSLSLSPLQNLCSSCR